MAYVYRKRNSWYGGFKDERGAQVQRKLSAKNKTEAQKVADDLERRADRVRLGLEEAAPSEMTFGALADRYERDALPALASPGTKRSRLKLHLRPAFGEKPIGQITPGDIDALLSHKAADGYSPQTREHLRKDLRRMFNFAAANKLVRKGFNPAAEAQSVDVPEHAIRYLEEQDVWRLLVEVPSQWRAAAAVAVMCGARKGEVAGIEAADVDLTGRALSLHRSYDRQTTKGRKARVVPIPEPLVPVLAELMTKASTARLFPRLTRNTDVADVIRRAMGRAGLVEGYRHKCRRKGCGHEESHRDDSPRECPTCGMRLWPIPKPLPIRFKELRSTWGTLAYDATGDIRFVQMVLGHHDPRLTERHYAARKAKKLLQQANQVFTSSYPALTGSALPGADEQTPSKNLQRTPGATKRAMQGSNLRPLAPEASGVELPPGRTESQVVATRPQETRAPGGQIAPDSTRSHRGSYPALTGLLTVRQVAKRLGVSTATVYAAVRSGDLPSVRARASIRIRPADLEAFIAPRKGHPKG